MTGNGTIDWAGKRAELQEKLQQAEQQWGFWGARRLQLQGALSLLDELAPPELRAESPPEARSAVERMDPTHGNSTFSSGGTPP